MRVTHGIVGSPGGELEFGWDSRAALERQLRDWEAGHPPFPDPCGFATFVPRYELDATYLVFMNDYEGKLTSWGEFRVDGADVVLSDEGLRRANSGFLYMSPPTYDRYFPGVPANEDRTLIVAERISLATLLRAVSEMRREPLILPPGTGSAGLAADR